VPPNTKVCLLGPLEMSGPGGVLRLSGARQRTILALLALRSPRVVSRAHLVDALWGTDPPPSAVKTLQSHVARIRAALAAIGLGELLITREPGYALALPDGSLDVAVFQAHLLAARRATRASVAAEELRAAAALWRGEPLADCPVNEWGRAEVVRLNEAMADAAERLAEAQLRLGEQVAGELERLVVRYPLRERLWELLVVAHHRSGHQAEALRAYRRARDVLVEELGVEPGARLRQLEADLLAGAAELDQSTVPARPAPAPVPATRDSLVGRQRELSEVLSLLAKERLVTLTGPGGCGKTRLALTAMAELPDARLVDLTPVRDPSLVAGAAAAALGVAERPGVEHTDALVESLTGRELVVVLDNCEHLVRAAAELVELLLARCPRLTVLATSREALRVADELTYPVPVLAVPNPEIPRTLAELAAYDSVRLFLDRSAATFADDDAAPIAALCAALDGLPLAIELAAARTAVLTPAQIVRRLRDRFGLLTYGSRSGSPDHHVTLRAAIDWSHDLLSPAEATLFVRLGVFVGGFSVEAAEAVGESGATLDALTGLVAKSLVRVWRTGEVTRFFMLETIAAYAVERLAVEADAAQVRHRHAEFFLAALEDERFDELRVERENLRAAMSWQAGRPDELRMATALSRYCRLHGHYREGRDWLGQALVRSPDAADALRLKALTGAASLALSECDYSAAERYATEGLALADEPGRLRVLLGAVAREQARYPDALDHYRAAEAAFRSAGNESGVAYARQFAGATSWLAGSLDAADADLSASLTWLRRLDDRRGAASSLAYLGAVALYRGEPARELLDEALELFGDLEFREGIAWGLNLLGLIEHAEGNLVRAATLLRASLGVHRELGDRWRQASVLEALGGVACATGEADRAALLLRQAAEIRDAIGAPVPVVERAALARVHEIIAVPEGRGSLAGRELG
jgi:predicted ATPase/DNA-binding SARP family transcriptional activator